MPAINQPPVLAAPREAMPPGFQGGFPDGEAPQPPDNSIPPWMRPGGTMQTPFSNPPQNMVPPLNGPQVSVAKPPMAAPSQSTQNGPSTITEMQPGWDRPVTYTPGQTFEEFVASQKPASPPVTASNVMNSWNNPIYYGSSGSSPSTQVAANAPPSGFMGTLGNAIGGFTGPVMRQFNGMQTLPPQLTNNGPVSPVTRRY